MKNNQNNNVEKINKIIEQMQEDKKKYLDFDAYECCGVDWFVSRCIWHLDIIENIQESRKEENENTHRDN